jgi:serine/threonine protein kinase
VVKSLRCYSSPEFDPAEVGIVSSSPVHTVRETLKACPQRFLKEVWASTQLSHPNIVPFLGVYSTGSHPFALLYEMMDNLDLSQYLAKRPNVSRLKLVNTVFIISTMDPWLTPRCSSSLKSHVR